MIDIAGVISVLRGYGCSRGRIYWLHSAWSKIDAARCGSVVQTVANLLNMVANSGTRRSTRSNHSNALIIPHCKTVRCLNSASIATANAYNCLPQSVIDLSLTCFKRSVGTRQIFDSVMLKQTASSTDFVTPFAKIELL